MNWGRNAADLPVLPHGQRLTVLPVPLLPGSHLSLSECQAAWTGQWCHMWLWGQCSAVQLGNPGAPSCLLGWKPTNLAQLLYALASPTPEAAAKRNSNSGRSQQLWPISVKYFSQISKMLTYCQCQVSSIRLNAQHIPHVTLQQTVLNGMEWQPIRVSFPTVTLENLRPREPQQPCCCCWTRLSDTHGQKQQPDAHPRQLTGQRTGGRK